LAIHRSFSGVLKLFSGATVLSRREPMVATTMSAGAYMGRASGFACWCNMAGKTRGRMILVAMISMGAPQAGQMIAGRVFRLRTWLCQGVTCKTSCSKRMSFLLHE
jgi:hypothetical protein